MADCPQCTLGFIQQRVFLIQKQVIFTGKSTPKNTDWMLITAPYLSHYHHCINAQLQITITMFMLLLCSVWSWSALPSPTGVLSSWSTVGNATKTWLTLWEPTLWVSNYPLRTSNLAPISSPGSSSDISSGPCRRHTGIGADHLFFSSPTQSLSPVRIKPSKYPSCVVDFMEIVSTLPPPGLRPRLLSLLSGRSGCPGGVHASTTASYSVAGDHRHPHMTSDHSWTLSEGSLFC